MPTLAFDQTIDLTQLPSPMPVLHARRALKTLRSGQVLRVIARGEHISRDFHDFSKLTGNTLQMHPEANGLFELLIQKR